jgi:hypothetical protein
MGPFSRSNVTRIAAPHGAAQRSTATLMDQRGWKTGWGAWTGPYATRFGTWPGRIERAGDTLRVFIHNPPHQLHRHHKWACFHTADNGWYRIHLHTNPVDGDPNAVVRYVEQLITESYHD